ncbi:acyl-CoA carboxylase subunit epsilon [Nocardia niigatensis]
MTLAVEGCIEYRLRPGHSPATNAPHTLRRTDRRTGAVTTMADEEVLRAAELDLAGVDELADAIDTAVADVASSNTEPVIRVLKGNPTDFELAALLSVFAAASASAAAAPADNGPADMWGVPTLLHRGSSPFSPYAFPALSHRRD